MNERITRSSAAGRRLIFHPADADECAALQKKLFKLGFNWVNGGRQVDQIGQCVATGLVLMDGKIYYRSPTDTTEYAVCTMGQVDPEYISADQRLMRELFDKLSAKVDALEKKVDRIYDELRPADIGKTKQGLKIAKPLRPRKRDA